MQDYRRLVVWKKAHQQTVGIYSLTKLFPANERYGLIPQMRRSAASVAFNIVEGCSRQSSKELVRYLDIALASAGELEYQLHLAHDLGFLPTDAYNERAICVLDVKRLIAGYRRGVLRKIEERATKSK